VVQRMTVRGLSEKAMAVMFRKDELRQIRSSNGMWSAEPEAVSVRATALTHSDLRWGS
jgi:hypothetical protein